MVIKRLVIDVLMPHEPGEIAYAEKISGLGNISIGIIILEVDEKTKTAEMIIEGESLSFDEIKSAVEQLGGSVHSIDEVYAGSRIVESGSRGDHSE